MFCQQNFKDETKQLIKEYLKAHYDFDGGNNKNGKAQMDRQRKKEERKKDIVKNYSCKKAVYENCKMLAPDGVCLSNCDRKKALWYIERGLADKVLDEPLTIKLKFEPANRKRAKARDEDQDDEFYVSSRENKCVVCGGTKDYARFFIVPSLYRVHLPDELKSHRSHDIVLLCFSCHEKASQKQAKLKQWFSEEYGISLLEMKPNKQKNIYVHQMIRAGKILKEAGEKMPENRREQLENQILKIMRENREMFQESRSPCPRRVDKFRYFARFPKAMLDYV